MYIYIYIHISKEPTLSIYLLNITLSQVLPRRQLTNLTTPAVRPAMNCFGPPEIRHKPLTLCPKLWTDIFRSIIKFNQVMLKLIEVAHPYYLLKGWHSIFPYQGTVYSRHWHCTFGRWRPMCSPLQEAMQRSSQQFTNVTNSEYGTNYRKMPFFMGKP